MVGRRRDPGAVPPHDGRARGARRAPVLRGAAGDGQIPGEANQKVLTNIIQAFHNNAILKRPELSKDLVDSGNTELRIVFNNLTMEEMNRIWGMFRNCSYKTCLSYTVTPVRLSAIPTEAERRVISKTINYRELHY